jgi:asparagine synthase (glutamine-hydrolysing)
MCGIAGFAGFENEPLLRSMCASVTHRGPDEDGMYSAAGVGLAMRRLAVIDLKTGRQPIANETRDVWVVFNGEIYNYQDLRRDLEARGHRLTTTSDTETIVHLYEEHGLDFVDHLRGMFAIALWDATNRRLVLARDRVGEKPLYYFRDNRGIFFGSEIKALLKALRSRSADPQAVCDFLALGYFPGSRTAFSGIKKLPPGHQLVFDQFGVNVRRYWKPTNLTQPISMAAAREQLAEHLSESVRLCLKSDVEVGAFLSGGIDSSVLVALMREHSARVQTFTVGYQGAAAGFNELQHARRVAADLGTEHHELILGAQSSLQLLPRILWHYDEPNAEPTSSLVYQLSEFTRGRVKVAIGGTGGDETFFGYPRHRAINLMGYYGRLPGLLRHHLVERVVARWPESTKGSRFAKRARRFVTGAALPSDERYLTWVRLLDRDVHAALIDTGIGNMAEDPTGERILRDYLLNGQRTLLNRAASLDVGQYLPEYQLTYVDRMSMAHGLEVRSPLCDHRLVDFVLSLPVQHRLNGLRTKHILKSVARRWLPRSIVNRPKVGFDSPIGQWFKDELRPFLSEFLSRQQVARTGLLNGAAVERMIADHTSGRRDYSLQLWSVVALEMWYRMYIEAGVTDRADCVLENVRGAGKSTVLAAAAS